MALLAEPSVAAIVASRVPFSTPGHPSGAVFRPRVQEGVANFREIVQSALISNLPWYCDHSPPSLASRRLTICPRCRAPVLPTLLWAVSPIEGYGLHTLSLVVAAQVLAMIDGRWVADADVTPEDVDVPFVFCHPATKSVFIPSRTTEYAPDSTCRAEDRGSTFDLVNHANAGHEANCEWRRPDITGGVGILLLCALEDIAVGDELVSNYIVD